MQGKLGFSGMVGTRLICRPRASLAWRLRNTLTVDYLKGWLAWHVVAPVANLLGVATLVGRLTARVRKASGEVVDYGVLSYRMVTTVFVNFMTDQLQVESALWGDFKYHDSGVGITDPAIGDIAIETTDGEARATGSQTESAANVYRSVGTIAYTTTKAITEHGLFNDATAGTLLDRSEFAAINVVNGDSIEFTYDLTCTAGG